MMIAASVIIFFPFVDAVLSQNLIYQPDDFLEANSAPFDQPRYHLNVKHSCLINFSFTSLGRLFIRIGFNHEATAPGVQILFLYLPAAHLTGATVVMMGTIALPELLRRGYRPELSTGLICAVGTLPVLIPPSVLLVILGDLMGVSVGDLFAAAMIPGLMLCLLYSVFIYVYMSFRPITESSPELIQLNKVLPREYYRINLLTVFIPSALLILAVLGSIFFGIAAPTEAADIGALGTLVIGFSKGKLRIRVLREVVVATTRLTSMIFMLLIGATAFGLVFRAVGGGMAVNNLLMAAPFGKWGAFIFVMLVIFVLGFFLDVLEILFIVIPLVAPPIIELGFNPLWFCIMISINLQTSFLTPPVGFALFFLRSVCPPEVSTEQVYKGVIPFILIQLLALVIVIALPALVTWLPELIY